MVPPYFGLPGLWARHVRGDPDLLSPFASRHTTFILGVRAFNVPATIAAFQAVRRRVYVWTTMTSLFQCGLLLFRASCFGGSSSVFLSVFIMDACDELIPVKATWIQRFLPLNISPDTLRQYGLARDQGVPCEKVLEMSQKSPRRSTIAVVSFLKYFNVECQHVLCALLFVPCCALFDLLPSKQKRHRIKMYVRRVYIMNDRELLPCCISACMTSLSFVCCRSCHSRTLRPVWPQAEPHQLQVVRPMRFHHGCLCRAHSCVVPGWRRVMEDLSLYISRETLLQNLALRSS